MKKLFILSLMALSSAHAHSHHDHPNQSGIPDAELAKFEDKDFLTGQGEFTYKVDLQWGDKPKGSKFIGHTHGGIAVDQKGHIYVGTAAHNGIIKYDPQGKVVKIFGPQTKGTHSMVLRKEKDGKEFLYVAYDYGKKVEKLDTEGKVIWTIAGAPPHPAYKQNKGNYRPTAVDVGPDGTVYICDGYATHLTHVYGPDHKYIKSFGGPGRNEGQFLTNHGLVVDSRGENPVLLIVDRENRRLQRFTLDGKFIDAPVNNLRRPCAVAFHGEYTAVAELSGRCVILDKDFKIVSILGDNPDVKEHHNFGVQPKDWKPTYFTAAHGIAFDAKGNLFVQDWNGSGRLRKFNLQK